MSRQEDFTFEQKEEIILRTFYLYHLLCPEYGIIKCPSCYCKMALGFENKKNGDPYTSQQSYQKIHLKMGYNLVPNFYENISRIHIDHLVPCFEGGKATFDNGIMICENCNLIFREFLSKEDKLFLLNNDSGLMDCDDTLYQSNHSNFKVIENGVMTFNGKDIIRSILFKRNINKDELDVIPMSN